jgi:hypothetical protein
MTTGHAKYMIDNAIATADHEVHAGKSGLQLADRKCMSILHEVLFLADILNIYII